MNFGPNDALGAGKIGPSEGDLEFYAGGRKERILRRGGHQVSPVTEDPPITRSNDNVFFFKLNDAGKMQFYVRFPSGASQIIATEP